MRKRKGESGETSTSKCAYFDLYLLLCGSMTASVGWVLVLERRGGGVGSASVFCRFEVCAGRWLLSLTSLSLRLVREERERGADRGEGRERSKGGRNGGREGGRRESVGLKGRGGSWTRGYLIQYVYIV